MCYLFNNHEEMKKWEKNDELSLDRWKGRAARSQDKGFFNSKNTC